jgi:uncharacterized membrane protein YczE
MRDKGAMQPSWHRMACYARPLTTDWPGIERDRVRQDGTMARSRLPRRLVQLYIGLLLYGLAGALQVRSRLGLDPWDVFHQGLAKHLGIAIGTVVIIVGAAVLLLWIPLRQWPGLGTLSNVVLIGLSMNWSLELLPRSAPLGWRIAEMLIGITMCGVATGMYIGASFGPGPRDGLMTGLARRTGRSIRLVRTCLELSVLAAGWLLGGTVGVGTVLFAVSIGPLAQVFLPLFSVSREPAPVGTSPPLPQSPAPTAGAIP